jgi:hypothetical protein
MTLVKEHINEFERGQEPFKAMRIGMWKDGYKIDEAKYKKPLTATAMLMYNSLGLVKKAGGPFELRTVKVTPGGSLEKHLEDLPVVTFKYFYDDTEGNYGLFSNAWPNDFPYERFFIANVLEAEGRSYLVDPNGFDNARYIIELQ